MVRVFMILLMVIFSAITLAQEKFHYKPYPKKLIVVETRNFETEMTATLKIDGEEVQKNSQKQNQKQVKIQQILDSSDKGVRKLKIEYKIDRIKQITSTGHNTKSKPLEGKGFILELVGDNIIVTGIDGDNIPPLEENIVKKENRNFGKPDPLSVFFDGREVTIGDKLDVPAQMAVELFGGQKEQLVVKEFSFTFQSIKKISGEKWAVFDTTLIMSGFAAPGVALSMDLKGTTIIGIENCHYRSLFLQGTTKMNAEHTAKEQKFEMIGEGKLKVELKNEFKQQ